MIVAHNRQTGETKYFVSNSPAIEKRQGRNKDYWQLQREIVKLQPIHNAMAQIEKLWKQIKTESAKSNPNKEKIDRLKQQMTKRAKMFLKRHQKAA
ncbi:MAG: hypothetical protein PHF37_05455 [Phycisphaerae bacterium]|nr:hypothetical protein [Phycisphaerae bacterium]